MFTTTGFTDPNAMGENDGIYQEAPFYVFLRFKRVAGSLTYTLLLKNACKK